MIFWCFAFETVLITSQHFNTKKVSNIKMNRLQFNSKYMSQLMKMYMSQLMKIFDWIGLIFRCMGYLYCVECSKLKQTVLKIVNYCLKPQWISYNLFKNICCYVNCSHFYVNCSSGSIIASGLNLASWLVSKWSQPSAVLTQHYIISFHTWIQIYKLSIMYY